MAADLQEQAVQVEWKAAKITAAALKGLIEQILANREKITHGEQSLKKLNLQGKKLESIELTGEDMQAFKRELNKYAVDFSIKIAGLELRQQEPVSLRTLLKPDIS